MAWGRERTGLCHAAGVHIVRMLARETNHNLRYSYHPSKHCRRANGQLFGTNTVGSNRQHEPAGRRKVQLTHNKGYT